MPSQSDLDQGGTSREMVLAWRGPSVGFIWVPKRNVFPITAGGTYNLDSSTNYVEVNTTGAVIINLPSAIEPASAMAQPGLFHRAPIVIVDIGGNAQLHPITIQPIQPNSNNETIMGLTSIQITVNFGGYTLSPNTAQKTWNSISP